MNILLIESDAEKAHGLAQHLEIEGFSVQIASGAFYALTMLERHPSDLVLCSQNIEELSVAELAEIVGEDSALSGLRVAGYGKRNGEEDSLGTDFWIESDVPSEVVTSVCRYVHRVARLADRMQNHSARVGLVGTLAIFELQELLQLLGFSGETGRMVLEMPSAVGRIFFLGGKIVHAEYRESQGDTAVGDMLSDAIQHSESRFRFERFAAEELSETPRTIETTIAQLLLTISVGLDTRRRMSG